MTRTDAQLALFAKRIAEALRDIDRMSDDIKLDNHADYDEALILAKLRRGWSPR